MEFKRTIIIICTLFFLIVSFGLFVNIYLKNTSSTLSNNVLALQDSVSNFEKKSNTITNNIALDYNQPMDKYSILKSNWNKLKNNWSILIDHSEIDNIQNSVARLESFVIEHDSIEALSESSVLFENITHIYDTERLVIKNIL